MKFIREEGNSYILQCEKCYNRMVISKADCKDNDTNNKYVTCNSCGNVNNINFNNVKNKNSSKIVLITLVFIVLAILSIIIIPKIITNNNFSTDVKECISKITSKYDCIISFDINGKFKNEITFKVNDNFKNMVYKQKVYLLQDVYNEIDKEIFSDGNLCTKYKLWENSAWANAINDTKVQLTYNNLTYYIDNSTIISGIEVVNNNIVNQDINTTNIKTDDEIIKEIKKQIQNPYIIDINMPDNDILMLHIAFKDEFFTLAASKQYQIIRDLFLKYDNILLNSGKNDPKHILRVFKSDKQNIVYTMNDEYFQSFNSDWFDNIDNISVFDLDVNPVQLNGLLNDKILAGGLPAIGNIWNYSSNKDENLNSSSISESNTATEPNAISLYYGGTDILVGLTDKDLSDAISCIANKDNYGFNDLVNSGAVFSVPSGTKAIIIQRKLTMNKVRILDSAYKGMAGWVVVEATESK